MAEIIKAARVLFRARGFARVTMREIAAKAGGISTGAIFAHFKDKAEVFLAASEWPADPAAVALDMALRLDEGAEGVASELRDFARWYGGEKP